MRVGVTATSDGTKLPVVLNVAACAPEESNMSICLLCLSVMNMCVPLYASPSGEPNSPGPVPMERSPILCENVPLS